MPSDVVQTAAVLGALLVLVGLGLVPLAVALARHLFPQRVVFFARWGFSQVLATFAVTILGGWAAVRLFPGTDLVTDFHRTLAVYGIVGLWIAYVAQRTHPDAREALGLEARFSARAVFTGLAVLLFLLPGIFGVGLLWPWLFERLGGEYQPQEVLLGFAELSGPSLAWGVALAVVAVPFFEELIFRGFLQPLFCQNLGEQGGIVITSVFFAMLHGSSAFLPIFVLSYVLGAVMVRTHRLAATWAMHGAFNAANLSLFLLLPESRELIV